MSKPRKIKTTYLGLRVGARVKRAIEIAAEQEDCSISFLVERVMRGYLARKGIKLSEITVERAARK